MQKRIIIFGEANTGKTRLAKQLAMAFNKPVFISRKKFLGPVPYCEYLNSSNEILIVDGLKNSDLLSDYFSFPDPFLIVAEEIFILSKILFTVECNEEFIDALPESHKRLCIFIKCEADQQDLMPTLDATRYYTNTEILKA